MDLSKGTGKVAVAMKSYEELVSTKPSKNYKIKDGMMVEIHDNVFKF